MGDDFTVHLISNVSPDTFPNNDPESFSTLLANEIDLNEGNWDVGVRQIMYPTHVATTSKKDDIIAIYDYKENYRSLLPYPPEDEPDLKNVGAILNFQDLHGLYYERTASTTSSTTTNPKPKTVTDKFENIANSILNTINNSKWKHIVKMTYNGKHRKLILNIFHDDIVIILSEALKKTLGFSDAMYTHGTYWANWGLLHTAKHAAESDMNMFIYDLQVLENEEHRLLKSFDTTNKLQLYEKVIPYKLKDTFPDEYYSEPKFSFAVHPNEGKIKLKVVSPLPKKYKKHESPMLCFRFDKNSTEKFQMKNIFYALNDKEEFWFPVSSNSVLDEIDSIVVRFYYANVGHVTRAIKQSPVTTFSIESETEIRRPEDLLVKLNEKAKTYSYNFSFNEDSKRYVLKVGASYALELSKSLASILGFSTINRIHHKESHTIADNSPILNRAITALYVYTNIIDSVYVGDVKAPLLLTCPFKRKSEQDIVHQLEFLNPTYVPLNRKTISQINVYIYDDAGTLVPFLYGNTKLTLHFRNRKSM